LKNSDNCCWLVYEPARELIFSRHTIGKEMVVACLEALGASNKISRVVNRPIIAIVVAFDV
jgi:hypothetical protein